MTTVEIPLTKEIFAYTERIDLDGATYVLTIRYNARSERWIMDIADADETALLQGIVLNLNYPLTVRFIGRIAGLPQGQFIVVDERDVNEEMNLENIGQDVKLVYQEAA